ncbi:hypothetical protein ACLOJK_013928 [Asimina triloba]
MDLTCKKRITSGKRGSAETNDREELNSISYNFDVRKDRPEEVQKRKREKIIISSDEKKKELEREKYPSNAGGREKEAELKPTEFLLSEG